MRAEAEADGSLEAKSAGASGARSEPASAEEREIAGAPGEASRRPSTAAAPEKLQDPALPEAQSGAGAALRAAEALRLAGDREGARRLLRSALSRTRGTPAWGALSLKLAELELDEKRYAEALAHAKAAAETPGFKGRSSALDVMERIARAMGSEPDVEWARARRARMRAEEVAPAAADR